jgi:hypothetical protein
VAQQTTILAHCDAVWGGRQPSHLSIVNTPGQILVRRTKQLWTYGEKRSICFQTAAPGVSVAQEIRRYVVNAYLVFNWLLDSRYAPEPVPSMSEESRLLPVEIVTEAQALCAPRHRPGEIPNWRVKARVMWL